MFLNTIFLFFCFARAVEIRAVPTVEFQRLVAPDTIANRLPFQKQRKPSDGRGGGTQSIISPRPEQIGRHPTRECTSHARGHRFLLAGTRIKNN